MVVMSTQLIGFSVGGILRRFLVQPASMSKSVVPFAPRVDRLTVSLASLAYQSCDLCTIQYPSSAAVFRDREPWRNHPRAVLLLRISGFVLLVLVPRLHFPGDVVL